MSAVRLATKEYVDKLMKCDVYSLKRKIEDYNGRGEEIAYDSDDIECYVSYLKRKYANDPTEVPLRYQKRLIFRFSDFKQDKVLKANASVLLRSSTDEDNHIIIAYYDDLKDLHILEMKMNISSACYDLPIEEKLKVDVYARFDLNNVYNMNKLKLIEKPSKSIEYTFLGIPLPMSCGRDCSSSDMVNTNYKKGQFNIVEMIN